jgi:hypothetical protein
MRTAAWTARAGILAWLLAQGLGAKDAPSA